MVIVSGTHGQFCNQLFRIGHHLANALALDYEVNLADFEYKAMFPNLISHNLIQREPVLSNTESKAIQIGNRYPLKLVLKQLFKLKGYAVIDHAYEFADSDTQFIHDAVNNKVLATHWDFRDYASLNDHHAAITSILSLPAEANENADKLLQLAHAQGNLIVGVHIRRGDYKTWNGGKYYFSDKVYCRLMDCMKELYPEKHICFILCSNEPIDAQIFSKWPVIIAGKSYLTDLAILSRCDLLIGPPSTFSAWASYVGKVPLYHVSSAEKIPVINDFVVARG